MRIFEMTCTSKKQRNWKWTRSFKIRVSRRKKHRVYNGDQYSTHNKKDVDNHFVIRNELTQIGPDCCDCGISCVIDSFIELFQANHSQIAEGVDEVAMKPLY